MINSIEQYLSELKKELSGSDRATVQDALSDAEEYLRNAFNSAANGSKSAPAEVLKPIIEKYGSPTEVAAAYKEIESRTPPTYTPPAPKAVEPRPAAVAVSAVPDTRNVIARFFGVYADPKAWASLLYLLFSLATGIIYFSWASHGHIFIAGAAGADCRPSHCRSVPALGAGDRPGGGTAGGSVTGGEDAEEAALFPPRHRLVAEIQKLIIIRAHLDGFNLYDSPDAAGRDIFFSHRDLNRHFGMVYHQPDMGFGV
jgi:hypothetical protein